MLKKFKKLAKDLNHSTRKKFHRMKNSASFAMCESCFAFYYKNSWHMTRPEYLSDSDEEDVPVFFTKCSACLEQEEAMYERESNLSFS